MESREILKEFAGKLAGLSAATKVVAIAGAVSAYSGTGHAAASDVKAESRFITTVDRRQNDTASDARKEESVVAKTEIAASKISEEVIKTLSANEAKDVAKAADAKATKVVKANVSPKILEKAALYEPKKESASKPKYDTRYYQAPGTAKTSERPTRSSSRSSYSSSSSYSSYNYNEPTAPSYVKGTSDDSAFGENASSSRSTSVASRSSRRSYDWRRTRTNSDTFGTASKDTDLKSKADGIGETGSKGSATASQSTGFANFSGFGGDGSSRQSAPKNDAKMEKALKIAEEIEKGEKKLVSSAEEKQAIELKQLVDQGKKKLVDADTMEHINEQHANVAREQQEVQQLRNELQIVRAENLELKGRQGGLQRQGAQVQILPQAQQANVNVVPQAQVVAQVQPVVQPVNVQPNAAVPPAPALEVMGIARVVPEQVGANVQPQDINNAIPVPPPPPPPPPGVPGADPDLNVIVGNGAGVPPPPPPPPPPPGVGGAGQPVVVAGQGQGVPPPPPPPPPPPGVANTNGVPPPPGVLAGNGQGVPPPAPVFAEPDIDAILGGIMTKLNDETKKQKEEKEEQARQAEKEGKNIFEAVNAAIRKVKNPPNPEKFDEDKYLMGLKQTFSIVAEKAYARSKNSTKELYILCDACIRILEMSEQAAEGSKEQLVCAEAVPPVFHYMLLSVAYFSGADKDAVRKTYRDECTGEVPDCILDRNDDDYRCNLLKKCREKYNIEFADVRKRAKSSFSAEQYAKCNTILAELSGDQGGVAEEPAAVDQCSPLDRIIFSNLGLSARKEGWYSADEIDSLFKKQKDIVDEEKPVKKVDLDDAARQKLMELVLKSNTAFWITQTPEKFVTAQALFQAKNIHKKCSLEIGKLVKKIKIAQLDKFVCELEKEWDKATERFANKGDIFKDLESRQYQVWNQQGEQVQYGGMQAVSKQQFWMLFGSINSLKTNHKDAVSKYEKMKLYPFVSKLRKSVMDAERLPLILDFDRNDFALMQERRPMVKKLLKAVLKFSKSNDWILKGEWVNVFLPDLNKDNVTSLTIKGEKENGRMEVVLGGLSALSEEDCPKLSRLKFDTVELSRKALGSLKPKSGVEVTFKNVDAPVSYKDEGDLKRLKDGTGKEPKYEGECSWAKDGVRPVAVVNNQNQADAVQPGMPRLRGIANNGGGHENNLLRNNVFDRTKLKKVDRKAVEFKKAGNAIAAEMEKIKANLKNVEQADRNDAILDQHKQIWRDNDEGKDVEIMLPLVLGLGDIFTTSAAAAEEAKKRDGNILFTGRFTDNLELGLAAVGAIVDNMRNNGIKSVKFSVDGLPQVAGNNAWYILDTFKHKDMNDNQNLQPDQHKHSLQSVEISGLAYGRFLEVLPDLKLEKLTFSGIADDAWLHNESFGFNMTTRDRWMAVFRNTKAVDLSICDFSEVSLSALRDILKAMKPNAGEEQNGNDADLQQVNEKALLEELSLPDVRNEQEQKVVQEIKNLVDELKGN